MRYWLMKSEPDVFSIDQLERVGSSGWDGVRNYQARNFMRDDMRVGDLVFFYHSNATPPCIAGIAEVSRESYPDPTQFDAKSEYHDAKATKDKPIWFMVEVKFVEKFKHLISLDTLRSKNKELDGFQLLAKGSRLSVIPVDPKHWKIICKLNS